jgi:hypothetical protein
MIIGDRFDLQKMLDEIREDEGTETQVEKHLDQAEITRLILEKLSRERKN